MKRSKTAPLLADEGCCKECRTTDGPFVEVTGKSGGGGTTPRGVSRGYWRGFFLCHPCFYKLVGR